MATATRRTRVVFAAHAFPRNEGDLTGGFLLRLAEALERDSVDVQAVAPAAPGLPATDRLRGVAVRRYRYAPRRAETLAYTGGMHTRASSPSGMLALAGLLASGTLALRRAGAEADLVHAHWWSPGRSSPTCTVSPRNWGSPTGCAGSATSLSRSWPPATAGPPPCWCPAATKGWAWWRSRASSPAPP